METKPVLSAGALVLLFLLAAPADADGEQEMYGPRAQSLVNSIRGAEPDGQSQSEWTTREPAVRGTHELTGIASWYAGKFQGRLTANGERFDTNLLTAAHKTLPFDTVVRVRHEQNGRTVDVRINDRGPFVEGRIIDLSRAAAEAIEMTGEGIAPVSLEILSYPPAPTYTIQIASFSSAANAERTRATLARSEVPARIEEAGALFRVVVQGVEADAVPPLRERLATLGYPSVLVRLE